jgi:hypothetical protein
MGLRYRWVITRRRYTGIEDSYLTPGVRKVATSLGYVLLMRTDGDRRGCGYAEVLVGGWHYRGWVQAPTLGPTPEWKALAKSFVRHIRRALPRRGGLA